MRQPDLFGAGRAQTFGRQGDLFQGQNLDSALRCCECGEYLVRTDSGYLACPEGHGKLLCEEQEPCGSWFE